MALINYLTRIHFADGVLQDALAEELGQLAIVRPLIIVDSDDTEAYWRVQDALPPRAVGIRFDLSARAAAGAEVARATALFAAMDCDAYIGLGGAAAISLARRAAYARCERGGGVPVVPRLGLGSMRARNLAVAIPTTTECVGLVPLFDPPCDRSGRQGASETAMLPDLILCDPTLTIGVGKQATAAAGMDTIARCMEAFLGTTWNPPADGIALDGIRRASASLPQAVDHGSDLAARREMMAAALNAGLASQKGLGAAHALALALEIEISPNVPYGYFHAALLPSVLAFNAPAVQNRLPDLREALHGPPLATVADVLIALGTGIALPQTLASLELTSVMRKRIAKRAAEDPASQTNPRYVTAADYVRILEQAGQATAISCKPSST
jgi:4-hydroxybutyrate dehydrogenase